MASLPQTRTTNITSEIHFNTGNNKPKQPAASQIPETLAHPDRYFTCSFSHSAFVTYHLIEPHSCLHKAPQLHAIIRSATSHLTPAKLHLDLAIITQRLILVQTVDTYVF